MVRSPLFCSLLIVVLSTVSVKSVHAADTLPQRVAAAAALLDGAEDRFQIPDPQWFETTRQALREETQRVDEALDSHGKEYAAAWKNHLRWPLLTGNLGEDSRRATSRRRLPKIGKENLEELALVRRWLYSNRKGLEYPFFAQLRTRIDAHLDAVYTCSRRDLESDFRHQVAVARQQVLALAAEPSDARAAELGRMLGWFERTRQLPAETKAIRELLSYPNAQIVIAKPLIDRAIGLLVTGVDQTLPVSDRTTVQNGGLFARSRTANVHGRARTHGKIALEMAANADWADLQLVYLGEIDSRCRAVIGPVTVAMQTLGPVRAVTPVQLSLQGVKLLTTEVFSQVETRVTGVSAKSAFIRRVGKRRAQEPESYQQMNSRARETASKLIQEQMDDRVATALKGIRSELQQTQVSMDSMQEVLAPVVREGASPHWEGIQSTTDGVIVNAVSQRREQFGAVNRCPPAKSAPDVQFRLHVSFFNNMAETIMAGKTFTDKYFMTYGKILQAELPPPLMVHARSVRWAIVAAKPRPLEITIPAPNQFRIVLRMQQVEIGDETFTGPTIATINYAFSKNEFDEYQLERQGDVELDSTLPEESRDFLLLKLQAFFAPVLDAGGVALPEGGSLGRLRGLQPRDAIADRDWLTLGVDVPTDVLEQWLPLAE